MADRGRLMGRERAGYSVYVKDAMRYCEACVVATGRACYGLLQFRFFQDEFVALGAWVSGVVGKDQADPAGGLSISASISARVRNVNMQPEKRRPERSFY